MNWYLLVHGCGGLLAIITRQVLVGWGAVDPHRRPKKEQAISVLLFSFWPFVAVYGVLGGLLVWGPRALGRRLKRRMARPELPHVRLVKDADADDA